MLVIRRFFVVVLVFLSVHSFCADDQWTESTQVKEIYTGYKEGHILFKTTSAHINPANCSDTGYYSVEPANADVASVLSILLAAKMSGSSIKVAVDGDRCGTSGVTHLTKKISVSRVAVLN